MATRETPSDSRREVIARAPERDACGHRCRAQAAAQLLGPLRPAVCVCAHGHHFTLDELFPPRKSVWENEDGSTDIDAFLAAYQSDDNTFWRAEQGHVQNVLDSLIERLAALDTGWEQVGKAWEADGTWLCSRFGNPSTPSVPVFRRVGDTP